jgi:hypothetical protein
MSMNLDFYTKKMIHNAATIRQMVADVSDAQARWQPDPGVWSILEVVNHLYDEEREDFRIRLDIMLHRPDQPLPKWDPEAAVIDRRYNERDITDSLDKFLQERQQSVRWLNGLSSPNMEALYENQNVRMTAGDMFASWFVHDLLHMRQLVTLQWKYTVKELDPFEVDYAGVW